ncbi:hypothetical protein MMC28_006736 [Mycoblastus sanguinarius]|nr:hypothetical protein [Mycoblastus sanguinarius]
MAVAPLGPLESITSTVTGIISLTPPNSYVLFTAYSITSDYMSNGICITTAGVPISMETDVSLTKPATVDPTAFRSSAISKFVDYIGFTSCANGGSGVVNLPDANDSTSSLLPSITVVSPALFSSSTSTSPTSTRSTAPKNASPGFQSRDKVGISVSIPTVVVVLFMLGIIHLRRRRKRSQSAEREKTSTDSPKESQPYLQQKPELDAEEVRKHELEARERRYELDGPDGRHEVSGADKCHKTWAEDTRRELLSLQFMHELRGEEHSKELEGAETLSPRNVRN